MKWIVKALAQKVMSALPSGQKLNYWFQRRSGGLPVSDEGFIEKVRLAHDRIRKWEEFGSKRSLSEIQCFEFGAGWDLIGPLAYWAFGVNHQIVIDVRQNLRPELVRDSIEKLTRLRESCEEVTDRKLRTPPSGILGADVTSDLKNIFGIEYLAPIDAANTKLLAKSIDFISTNSTLEHIPASALPAIMRECKRLLKEDGIQCHFIDMKDHFSYFDSSITKYNFLTLSDLSWALLNSPLANQNRLRYGDYHRIFSNEKLVVVEEEVEWAPDADLRDFRSLRLAPRFAGTDSDEHLAAHILRVVLA
jgi:hypothetical protein